MACESQRLKCAHRKSVTNEVTRVLENGIIIVNDWVRYPYKTKKNITSADVSLWIWTRIEDNEEPGIRRISTSGMFENSQVESSISILQVRLFIDVHRKRAITLQNTNDFYLYERTETFIYNVIRTKPASYIGAIFMTPGSLFTTPRTRSPSVCYFSPERRMNSINLGRCLIEIS